MSDLSGELRYTVYTDQYQGPVLERYKALFHGTSMRERPVCAFFLEIFWFGHITARFVIMRGVSFLGEFAHQPNQSQLWTLLTVMPACMLCLRANKTWHAACNSCMYTTASLLRVLQLCDTNYVQKR